MAQEATSLGPGLDDSPGPTHALRSVAGKPTMLRGVWTRSLRAKSLDLVGLVISEVALEPEPAWDAILVLTLPGQDVSSNAVQEPAVVGDHHGAAGEFQ